MIDWKPVLNGQEPKDDPIADFGGESSPFLAFCDPRDIAVLTGELGDPEVVDVNRDGIADIRLKLTYAAVSKERMTALKSHPDYRHACACSINGAYPHGPLKPGCQCPSFDFPALTTTSLVFLAHNDSFVPTPETQGLLVSLAPFSEVSAQCAICSTLARSTKATP